MIAREFFALPSVASPKAIQRWKQTFRRNPPDDAEVDAKVLALIAELKDEGEKVVRAYEALLARVRLAELVLYRVTPLPGEMRLLVEREQAKGRTLDPAGLAEVLRRYVRDYVEPVLGPLREALGFEEGQESEGWYLEPEEWRAKLVGNVRAQERLRREGRL